MKKLLMISTGGTIACTCTDDGLAPNIKTEGILDYLTGIEEICEIETHGLINIDSTNIQPEHWVEITEFIRKVYGNYDGFIITHGTDTMAYTASALSYMIQNADKPIIITGSQKPINMDTTDAIKNLKDSIAYALSGEVNGVYIVFDGKAIIGTRARKTKTKSFNAFESINYPIAAFIDGERIAKYVKPESKGRIEFHNKIYPNVFLLKLIPGMQPDILDYIGDKYECIIIESYGVGGLPFEKRRNFQKKIENLTAKGRIVVVASQVMEEGSDMAIYEVGLRTLKNNNVLESLDMTIESVVTKLMWIMGRTRDFEEVKDLFYRKVNEDIIY